MADTTHPVSHTCRNCGHTLDGPYCSECGQSEHDGQSPSVGHFFHDLVHEFVHVDGKIFATLKALFFQPGKLTAEYWAGRVNSWVRPIRLFLVIAAIHLLISNGVGPMNFAVQLERGSKGDLSVSIHNNLEQISSRKGQTPVPEDQRREFFEKFEKVYDTIRYFSVLLFALGSWLLYRRQQPYFASHLIAGLHFYSFWYSIAVLASLLERLQPIFNGLTFLSCVYLFLALGRLFHEHWVLRLVKTLTLFAIVLAAEGALALAAALWVARRL
jgi:hypothetical protein